MSAGAAAERARPLCGVPASCTLNAAAAWGRNEARVHALPATPRLHCAHSPRKCGPGNAAGSACPRGARCASHDSLNPAVLSCCIPVSSPYSGRVPVPSPSSHESCRAVLPCCPVLGIVTAVKASLCKSMQIALQVSANHALPVAPCLHENSVQDTLQTQPAPEALGTRSPHVHSLLSISM